MSGEEDELPDWWRGPPVLDAPVKPAVAKPTRVRWTCTGSRCDKPIRPPWDRRPGVLLDDYCGPGCVPDWITSGLPAPFDRWRRSGGRA